MRRSIAALLLINGLVGVIATQVVAQKYQVVADVSLRKIKLIAGMRGYVKDSALSVQSFLRDR